MNQLIIKNGEDKTVYFQFTNKSKYNTASFKSEKIFRVKINTLSRNMENWKLKTVVQLHLH